jgi:hypothetical protein
MALSRGVKRKATWSAPEAAPTKPHVKELCHVSQTYSNMTPGCTTTIQTMYGASCVTNLEEPVRKYSKRSHLFEMFRKTGFCIISRMVSTVDSTGATVRFYENPHHLNSCGDNSGDKSQTAPNLYPVLVSARLEVFRGFTLRITETYGTPQPPVPSELLSAQGRIGLLVRMRLIVQKCERVDANGDCSVVYANPVGLTSALTTGAFCVKGPTPSLDHLQ